MSKKINAALDRRSAIRVGAVGAVATAATVAAASNAEAAAGQAVVQGAVNTVGTAGTTLQSSGTAISLTVKNTGAGAGAFFFAQNNNGFAGGTGGGNKYGLSAANTGAAGTGAGLAASGINNTGILANTGNSDRFALEAVNLNDTGNLEGGAIWAEGGETPALVTFSQFGTPAQVTIGDILYVQGHEFVLTHNSAVLGVTSDNGPEVTFTGQIHLDASGAGSFAIESPTVLDVDMASAFVLVSPSTGPMPNLWGSVNSAGVVSVAGGAVGSVTFRVVAMRTDWIFLASDGAKTTRTKAVSTVRAIAAKALKRADRG